MGAKSVGVKAVQTDRPTELAAPLALPETHLVSILRDYDYSKLKFASTNAIKVGSKY